jgi:hypothetical protein
MTSFRLIIIRSMVAISATLPLFAYGGNLPAELQQEMILADFTFPSLPGMGDNYGEQKASEEKISVKAYLRDPEAMGQLGDMYYQGGSHIVEQNYKEAVTWYGRAAEKGNRHAQLQLIFMYAVGQGVAADDAAAIKWYKTAYPNTAELAAIRAIADAFDNTGTFAMINLEYDPWHPKKFERHREAIYGKPPSELGSVFHGEYSGPSGVVEAARWYKKAAEQGDLEAQKTLAAGYDGMRMSIDRD